MFFYFESTKKRALNLFIFRATSAFSLRRRESGYKGMLKEEPRI
jgi:hypothetical protein